MKNNVFIMIIFSCFFISINNYFMEANADESIIGIQENLGDNIKEISLSSIEDGSKITDIQINFSSVSEHDGECRLIAIDQSINHTPLSTKFDCNSHRTISLIPQGLDAIESQIITDDQIKILITSDSGSPTTISINSIDIEYEKPQYYARITNGIVDNVIVDDGHYVSGQPDKWVRVEGELPGIGYIFDGIKFTPPKPYPSWILSENDSEWLPPVPLPDEEHVYLWNEDKKNWVEP